MSKLYIYGLILFLSCGRIFAGYYEAVNTDSPVAWWRFDDVRYKDGYAATDAIGNTQATYQGDTMTVDAGIDGSCAWFNGNKAGIDLGNTIGELIDQSSAVTVEMWIKNSYLIDGYPTQRIFASRIDGGGAGIDISIGISSGQGYMVVAGRSNISDSYLKVTTNFSAVDQWTHVVCVYDYPADSIKIYFNGSLSCDGQVDFTSDFYVFGTPDEIDQIGRSPDMDSYYRGYIDEIAVYNKALSLSRIQAHYTAGNPAQPASLWVSEMANDGAFEGPFISSPSMHKFADGTIVASHDYFGENKPVDGGTSVVKISYNDGLTWWPRGTVADVCMATLFEHDGDLYLFGISRNPGHITISKSSNYGSSWTTRSILFQAQDEGTLGYHTGPVPVAKANGRIYRVFERKVTAAGWSDSYAPVVVSADENSNLLDPASWTMTNAVEYDPQWADPAWGCSSPGWLEGNVVQAPDGSMVVLMRADTDPAVDIAAILSLSSDNTTLTFDPETGFIDMPGGMHKFDIHRDPATGKYLTLNNNNTDPTRPHQRNTLSLIASDDLINWEHVRTVLQDNSPLTWYDSKVYVGFQYVVWEFDGDDIIYMSRTSYDGAHNYHDSNKATFHRIEDYQSFVVPCGTWGYLAGDLNQDCQVDISDMAVFFEGWLSCTLPYADDCVYSSL